MMGYLFAAYAVVWVGLFVYLFWLGSEVRGLRQQIEELTRSGDERSH